MPRVPNQRKEYTAHYNRVERYASLLDGIYKQADNEFAKLALSINPDLAKPFKWVDYPQIKKKVDALLKGVASNIEGVIINGATAEWEESNFKNDRLARSVIDIKKFDKDDKGRDIIPKRFKPYFNNNADALQSFIGRKQKGISLSQKVWKLSEQYKDDLELALSIGLSDGRSAAELSRDIRQYLNEPKKLFRRVMRDDKLRLSKPAKAYHPGQGVYRSSYKNAMRLTRTEINMAYRTADSVRWGQMDFIVGFEVKRSGRGYDCSVCSAFAGKYPKDFKFVGWHPHCRCYVIPILKTDEEFWAWDGRGNAPTDSVNKVTDIPQGYKDWVGSNRERIAQAKENGTLPYFLRDNSKYLDAKAEQPVISTIKQRALERHTARTTEQISDIQSRWDKGDNVRAVERELGIAQGKPMTFEEANELKGNVNYGKSREYSINCQSCVVANELRRRGFDVTAFGKFYEEQTLIGRDATLAWIDPVTGQKSTRQHIGITTNGTITKAQQLKDIEEFTLDEGRYTIGVAWTQNRGRHIITAERMKNGELRIYDPQCGRKWIYDDWIKEVYNTNISKRKDIRVQRIDNLLVNTKLISKIVTTIK